MSLNIFLSDDEKSLLAQEHEWRAHLDQLRAEVGTPGAPNFGSYVSTFEEMLADARRQSWKHRADWLMRILLIAVAILFLCGLFGGR